MAIAELAGQRFDHLLVLELVEVTPARGALWRCRCDCGGEVIKPTRELKRGAWTQRCAECTAKAPRCFRHGETGTPTYRLWQRMRERCSDPRRRFHHGKGIRVCAEWEDYEVFRDWALANGFRRDADAAYADRLAIDRIDPRGHYEPGNCRFITVRENGRRVHDALAA